MAQLTESALEAATQAILQTKPYELRDSYNTIRRARIDAETAVSAYLSSLLSSELEQAA
jgi:hypothetical protein